MANAGANNESTDRATKATKATAAKAKESSAKAAEKTASKAESVRLLLDAVTIEEVMERTGRARSTVIGDLCELIETGRYRPSLRLWMSEETESAIRRAAAEAGIAP